LLTWHPDHLHDLRAMVTKTLDLEKKGQICEPFGGYKWGERD
jgi:hypothetical protein